MYRFARAIINQNNKITIFKKNSLTFQVQYQKGAPNPPQDISKETSFSKQPPPQKPKEEDDYKDMGFYGEKNVPPGLGGVGNMGGMNEGGGFGGPGGFGGYGGFGGMPGMPGGGMVPGMGGAEDLMGILGGSGRGGGLEERMTPQ